MKKLEQGKALSYLAEQEKNTLFTLCEESEESFSLCGLHVTPVTYTEEQMEAFRLAAKGYEIVCVKESDELIEEARQTVDDALQRCLDRGITDWGKLKNTTKDSLSDFVWKKTKRRPMILPIIMEV